MIDTDLLSSTIKEYRGAFLAHRFFSESPTYNYSTFWDFKIIVNKALVDKTWEVYLTDEWFDKRSKKYYPELVNGSLCKSNDLASALEQLLRYVKKHFIFDTLFYKI